MTDAVALRPAEAKDAVAIAALAGELGYPATVPEMEARLALLLGHPLHRVCVAEADGALLGWIAVEHRMTLESGEKIEIVGLVVSATTRRGGVGRMLLADAEQWARDQGFASVMVRSNVARAQSHPFYEQHGYVRRKTQHVYTKAVDARSSS